MREVQSLGAKRGVLKARAMPPKAVVVHTTGWGPNRRHLENPKKYATPLDAAIHVYTRVMEESAHIVIDQEGNAVRTNPDSLCAWHVGSKNHRLYNTKSWTYLRHRPKFLWWSRRWSWGSPRDLVEGWVWNNKSPNSNTIGIEVIPSLEGPRKPWSAKCLAKLEEILKQYDLPVLTHSDVDPISRSKNGVEWDVNPVHRKQLEEITARLRGGMGK